MEASERRAMEEKDRRVAQERKRLKEEEILRLKVWSVSQMSKLKYPTVPSTKYYTLLHLTILHNIVKVEDWVQKDGACAWVLQVEAQGIARRCLKNVTDEVYAALTKAGYFYDPVEREVYLIPRISFHPQTDTQHSLIMLKSAQTKPWEIALW